MKLLLTSSGITNPSIAKALFELVGKASEDVSLIFVPTASNLETGDKSWVTKDLENLKNLNLKSIDIVDISKVDKDIWKPKFENADILFFEGGDLYYLMEWINKSGLTKVFQEILKNKVYVGVSAGSMVLGKKLGLEISQKLYEENLDRDNDMSGLNFVDFYFLPHLNSPYFEKLKENSIREIISNMSEKIYVMDDDSALKIDGDKIEVVSEGEWFDVN